MDTPDERTIETAKAIAALTTELKNVHAVLLDERELSRKREQADNHFRSEMLVRMDRMDASITDSRDLWKEHINHGGHPNLQGAVDQLTQRIILLETSVRSVERDLNGKVNSAGFAWLWRVVAGAAVIASAMYSLIKLIEFSIYR